MTEKLDGIRVDGTEYSFIDESIQHKLNEEWVKAVIDKNNKVVTGIKKDGTFVCQEIESPTINELRNEVQGFNILFLGDSYTQNANWVRGLQKLVKINNFVNLGTSSGHLKDNYTDREAYPYTDRIYQGRLDDNGSIGNINTFSSQVEWIKRMNAGDLRGPLYQIAFTDATSDGTIDIDFPDITNISIPITSDMKASDIAESFSNIVVENHRIIHPAGQSYADVECMTNAYSKYPTISATGATATVITKRGRESAPFNGEQPHFIIIAGGKNDSPDSDNKMASYESQVIKQVSGYVSHYGSTPSVQNIYIQTPDEEVDRTCFVGALRHIMFELHSIYPKAMFIFIGTSGINYASSSLEYDIEKNRQCEIAASYLSLPFVSWVRDGHVNRLFNFPAGDGTQTNPWNSTSSTEDTTDMMHPNDAGGLKLAVSVAAKINEWGKYIKLINT